MQKTSPLDSNLIFNKDISDEITKIINYHFGESSIHYSGFDAINKEHPFYNEIVFTCLDLGYIRGKEIPIKLQNDPDFWIEWLNCNKYQGESFDVLLYFKYMSKELKCDPFFAKRLLLKNPFTIEYFDESVKEDKDFVLYAISNGNSKAYIPLKNLYDKEFVLNCLKANWQVWCYLKPGFAKDKDVFASAYDVDPVQTLKLGGQTIFHILTESDNQEILSYAFERSASTVFSYFNDDDDKHHIGDVFSKLQNNPEKYFETCLSNLGNTLGISDKTYKAKKLAGIPVTKRHLPLLDFVCSKIRTQELEKLYPKLEQDVTKLFVNDEITRRKVHAIKVETKNKKQNNASRKVL